MIISRIQIEEGFLDGMDVELAAGLNVVIGARGTGKTSLLELVRFCLDVKSYTSESGKRSREHALSVLGSGQISITLSEGDRRIVVTRTASDATPRASASFTAPIMFSQTEIENVGLKPSGRLNLIDSFAGSGRKADAEEVEAIGEVRSTTGELELIRRELDTFTKSVAEIASIDEQITSLAPAEQELSKVSAEAAAKKKQLDELSGSINATAVAAASLDRYRQGIARFRSALTLALESAPRREGWPTQAGDDPLVAVRVRLATAERSLQAAARELETAERDVNALAASANGKKVEVEERARHARREIEQLQAGAGEVVRRLQLLREKKAQLLSVKALIEERKARLVALQERRSRSLDRLDKAREARFNARTEVSAKLNRVLGPRIRITAGREGQVDAFASLVGELLKGSGLRYNDLSVALASNTSPRELVEATDAADFALVAEVAGISKDRAARVLGILRDADLGALATVTIDDVVQFQLLDGADYKDITELSTGQRCTVVLPLIMRHADRSLVVDQPEDHIDNAFIADTLIKSLQARSKQSQIIFSTHNANIPVLGNANRVVQLGSDGRRGFVVVAGPLDHPEVVEAITSIMEGGAEAFHRRAQFYQRHQKS